MLPLKLLASKYSAMVFHQDLEAASPVLFIVSVLAIQILGILAMVLTGVWMKHYLGGFAWDGSGHEFDYHPLCMVISLVFLYSEGKIFTCFLILRGPVHTPNMFISRSRHLKILSSASEAILILNGSAVFPGLFSTLEWL